MALVKAKKAYYWRLFGCLLAIAGFTLVGLFFGTNKSNQKSFVGNREKRLPMPKSIDIDRINSWKLLEPLVYSSQTDGWIHYQNPKYISNALKIGTNDMQARALLCPCLHVVYLFLITILQQLFKQMIITTISKYLL